MTFLQKDSAGYRLLWMWLPMHIFALVGLALISNPMVAAAALVSYIWVSGLGISVGYHRFYSHRSFNTKEWIQVLMAWGGALGCQGKPIYWASIHRVLHHPKADTLDDPHSPIHGRWHAFMGWMFKIDPKTARLKGVGDLVRDPIVVWFHKHYYSVLWGTWLLLAVVDWRILVGFAIGQLWAFHQENLIDLFCHTRGWWGYRNHDTPDNSVNCLPLGYLAWGQGWHNNHHHKMGVYNYGQKWWEVDLGAWLVRVIKT